MSDISRRGSSNSRRNNVRLQLRSPPPTTASSIPTFTCGSMIQNFRSRKGQNVPARDATPETLLGLMKSNGVSNTVIIQVIHYKYDNRFLAPR